MLFHTKNQSAKVCHRYTLVKMIVAISIIPILLAIALNIMVRSNNPVINRYLPVLPAKAKTKPAKKAEAVSKIPVLTTDEKITALEKAAQAVSEPGEIVFPEPSGIVPGKAKLTVFAPEAPGTEPFAKFLLKKGSTGSMKEYKQLWSFDTEALKQEKKSKLARGINVPLFSQYLRKKAIFESSPYRTYVLRKRILLASCKHFNPQESAAKYKALAEKKFRLCLKGEQVNITSVQNQAYTGKYNGKISKQISIKSANIQDSCLLPLEQISPDHRWKFDQTACNAKREEFVKLALAKERELETKQDEYVRKTLEAEFPMLKEDPLTKEIWQNMKTKKEQKPAAGGR